MKINYKFDNDAKIVSLFTRMEKISSPFAVKILFEFLFYDESFHSKLEFINDILNESKKNSICFT